MNYLIENIKAIRPRIEEHYNEKFTNRYATARRINQLRSFSYQWQPYAWAAIIGFINDRRRKVEPPTTTFGEFGIIAGGKGSPEVFKSLILLVIANEPNWDNLILNPKDYLKVIDEYANGGFDYLTEVLDEKGEKYFDEFENMVREIQNRN